MLKKKIISVLMLAALAASVCGAKPAKAASKAKSDFLSNL